MENDRNLNLFTRAVNLNQSSLLEWEYYSWFGSCKWRVVAKECAEPRDQRYGNRERKVFFICTWRHQITNFASVFFTLFRRYRWSDLSHQGVTQQQSRILRSQISAIFRSISLFLPCITLCFFTVFQHAVARTLALVLFFLSRKNMTVQRAS